MSIDKFIKDFASTLDNPETEIIGPDTKLTDIKQFDSMAVLSVIAMMHKVYQTKIKGADIKNAVTVADLYAFITPEP
jgi:acyl carrier protein